MKYVLNLSKYFLVGVLSLSTSISFAEKKGKAKSEEKKESGSSEKKSSSYQVKWGMAGCGLWGQVIKDKDRWPQLGVWALRNFLIYDSQSSAILTGTPDCNNASTDEAMLQMEQEVYVSVNLNSLSKESAQGNGSHLQALAEVFGCSNHQAFAEFSQSNFDTIYGSMDSNTVLNNYRSQLKANVHQVGNCVRVL